MNFFISETCLTIKMLHQKENRKLPYVCGILIYFISVFKNLQVVINDKVWSLPFDVLPCFPCFNTTTLSIFNKSVGLFSDNIVNRVYVKF